ncbi:MAG: MFS transporter [Thaumarchaeota archaeon]|nr:MFS transporter [Nitrososphaerota archaeon]
MPDRELREPRVNKGFFSYPSFAPKDFRRYLFSAFTGNLVLPIFSLYVPLLALRLGASVFEIGLVGGASNAVYSFMPFVMGHFTDRRGSGRFFIISSFVLLTAVSILYILIANPVYLIVARIFEGVGWAMLWPAIDAAISKDLSASDAKKVFSVFNITWSGAAALGPLVGSALIFFTSIEDAFFATMLILLLSAAVNIRPLLVSGRRALQEDNIPSGDRNQEEIIGAQNLDRDEDKPKIGSVFYMASLSLAAVTSGVLFTFFAPYAKSIGLSILAVGVITFIFGLGRFIAYVATVNESVRHLLLRGDKRARNMVLAVSLTAISSLILIIRDPSGIAYLVAYGIAGAGMSVVFGIAQAGMIAEASRGKFGRNAGLYESSIGIGACLGPIVGGSISGNSIAIPFIVPFLGFVVYLASLPIIARKKR